MTELTVTYMDRSTETFVVDDECWEQIDNDRPSEYWLRLWGDDLAVLIRTETIRSMSA